MIPGLDVGFIIEAAQEALGSSQSLSYKYNKET